MIADDGIRIRAAARQDLEAIARIHVEAWRDSYAALLPAEYLARLDPRIEAARWARFGGRSAQTLVAEAEGEVVGYASLGPARGQYALPTGEIYSLYVDTDWREHGIGRALVERAFELFRRDHLRGAVIWCLEGNFAARGFYARCGGESVPHARVDEVAGMPLSVVGYRWRL